MTAATKPRPSRRSKSASPTDKLPEVGVDLSTPDSPDQLHMPNERDEKVGMTGGVPSSKVQQAARDVKRGVQDTSRASEAGAAYEKLKR